MAFNCELCQSEFSVLSGRIIIKLSKICFLCTYVYQMIIQQKLMFCFKFSFTIFLPMFFSFFSNVFTNILKIYELLKINNTIPKYCQTFVLTKIIYQFYVTTSSGFWTIHPINFTENMFLRAKDSFHTKLKKSYVRFFLKKCSAKGVLLFCCIKCCPYSLQ